MIIKNLEKHPFETTAYQAPSGKGNMQDCFLPWFKARTEALPDGIEAIVIASDLQGVSPTWSKSPPKPLAELFLDSLEALSELKEIPSLDKTLLILAGDLFSELNDVRRGLSGNIYAFLRRLAEISTLKSLVVLGNHDFLEEQQRKQLLEFKNLTLLAQELEIVGGVKFGGIDGVIGTNNKVNRVTPEEFEIQIKKLHRQNTDVLVLHEGPEVASQGLMGNELITSTLSDYFFPLVISGHAHWKTAISEVNGSQLVNVDGRVIVVRE